VRRKSDVLEARLGASCAAWKSGQSLVSRGKGQVNERYWSARKFIYGIEHDLKKQEAPKVVGSAIEGQLA
jgi:hypothetical protein